jgi:hypothetical protein
MRLDDLYSETMSDNNDAVILNGIGSQKYKPLWQTTLQTTLVAATMAAMSYALYPRPTSPKNNDAIPQNFTLDTQHPVNNHYISKRRRLLNMNASVGSTTRIVSGSDVTSPTAFPYYSFALGGDIW